MKKLILFAFLFVLSQLKAQDSIQPTIDSIQYHPIKNQSSWNISFHGFIQSDVIIDNKKLEYIDGYLPSYMSSNSIDYNSYFTMRQSQLGLGVGNSDLGINGYVEIDFIGPDNKNQPRLRKLYFTYKNWKIGQDWSNLNDLNSWPNLLDFNGPNAALYKRRMQITYSKKINPNNSFSISLEDPSIPEITLPQNDKQWKKKEILPNLIGAYQYGNKSYIRAAGVLSPISYHKRNHLSENSKTHTTLGYGINMTSVIYTNKLSNFKLVVSAGKGTASNVISFQDEGYDAIVNPNNPTQLKKLSYFSTVVAYEHWWNKKWSSVAFYSGSFLGNKKYSTESMLKRVQHFGINTVYQPISYFRTGFDLTYGYVDRYQIKNKTEAARLQLSAIFSF